MATITIPDLHDSRELDREAIASLRGGYPEEGGKYLNTADKVTYIPGAGYYKNGAHGWAHVGNEEGAGLVATTAAMGVVVGNWGVNTPPGDD